MSKDTRPKATVVDEEDLTTILERESEVAISEPTVTEDRDKPSMARRTKTVDLRSGSPLSFWPEATSSEMPSSTKAQMTRRSMDMSCRSALVSAGRSKRCA